MARKRSEAPSTVHEAPGVSRRGGEGQRSVMSPSRMPYRTPGAAEFPTAESASEAIAARILTYRGELRCFSCGRYLGEFESHPKAHGPGDVHFLAPEGGQQVQRPVMTDRGLRCPACDGRVVASEVDRVAA